MKKQIILAACIAITGIAKAQNFTGHYTQQSKEMVDGKEYVNAIASEITVTQTKDSIIIVRITPAGGENTTSSREALPLNGKAVTVTTTSKRKKVSSIEFNKAAGEATLTYTFSYAEKPGETEYTNTEKWQLTNGTLTITKTSDAAVTDDWTIKATYTKQ